MRKALFVLSAFCVVCLTFGLASAGQEIPADVNDDCRVDVCDLVFVLDRLGQDPTTGDNWRADVNQDGRINIADIILVRNNLMRKCQPSITVVSPNGGEVWGDRHGSRYQVEVGVRQSRRQDTHQLPRSYAEPGIGEHNDSRNRQHRRLRLADSD